MELNDFILERKNNGLLIALDHSGVFSRAKDYINIACDDEINSLNPQAEFRPQIKFNEFTKDLLRSSLLKLKTNGSNLLEGIDPKKIKAPRLSKDDEYMESIDCFLGKDSTNFEERKDFAFEFMYSNACDQLNYLERKLGIDSKIKDYEPMNFENYGDSPDYIMIDVRDSHLIGKDLNNLNEFLEKNKIKAVVLFADSEHRRNYSENRTLGANFAKFNKDGSYRRSGSYDIYGKFLMRCEDSLPKGVNFFVSSPDFLLQYNDSARLELMNRVSVDKVLVFGRNSYAKESIIKAITESSPKLDKELDSFEK